MNNLNPKLSYRLMVALAGLFVGAVGAYGLTETVQSVEHTATDATDAGYPVPDFAL